MKDLTTNLETEIAQAVNKLRDTLESTVQIFLADIAVAHQTYEVAAGLRVEQAHKAMAEQITVFLGKEPYTALPPVTELHISPIPAPIYTGTDNL